jgi:hypothetical protein
MAVPSVVLSFLPLLENVIEKADGVTTTTWRYGTLWEMAGRDGGGPAAASAVILASFVVLLVPTRSGCSRWRCRSRSPCTRQCSR